VRRFRMSVNIYPITLGFDHCYIIQEKGTIMIDGGAPKQLKEFIRAIEEKSIKPEDIKLMIITHGHWDHIGSAKEIKEFTGAKIAMHEQEKEWLEKGLKPMPPGVTLWGSIFKGIMAIFMPLVNIPKTDVDVVLGDQGLSLDEYGISGKVIYTPGHSLGSVSVLLETGEVFVGDMAMNKFPLRLGPGMPIFAEDMAKLKESWNLLLDAGAKNIYPAHGESFPVDIIRKALS
jgi:glyoxylase-like metal-dependent hydrolase (beta-lactamase superfamily II)